MSNATITTDYGTLVVAHVPEHVALDVAEGGFNISLEAAEGLHAALADILGKTPDYTKVPWSPSQRSMLFGLWKEAGLTAVVGRHQFATRIVGRTITSWSELTFEDASRVIDALQAAVLLRIDYSLRDEAKPKPAPLLSLEEQLARLLHGQECASEGAPNCPYQPFFANVAEARRILSLIKDGKLQGGNDACPKAHLTPQHVALVTAAKAWQKSYFSKGQQQQNWARGANERLDLTNAVNRVKAVEG